METTQMMVQEAGMGTMAAIFRAINPGNFEIAANIHPGPRG
jgi:hypothetical protein